MTRALVLAAASAIGLATPALAQHAGHTTAVAPAPATDPSCPPEHAAMGHCTPKAMTPAADPPPQPGSGDAAPTSAPQTGAAPSAADPSCPPEHAAMGHCTPKAASATDPHAGHSMGNAAAPGAPPVAPPPQAAFSGPEHAADTVFDPKLMAEKRANELIAEHGGYTGYMVLLDRFEYRAVEGRDGYAWEGDAWYGGDYDRLWVKSEGEGEFGRALEAAEVQALYSRAIDPWFNLQAGVRYDIRPKPDRAHLAIGIQGLAPYWFEVDGALFLSDKGDLTARFEAEYDQRITNRLILQPRVEFDLAAQDAPEIGVGAGLSSAEAGLRLRYEVKREFAPYVGVEYERRFGDTADLARTAGEDVSGWAFVVGMRTWL